MNRMIFSLLALGIIPAQFFLSGCQTTGDSVARPVVTGVQESPIGSVVQGQAGGVEGYLEKVRQSNEAARQEETREINKETVRAYNLDTGKYEYVPLDSLQKWNEEEKRWEFRERPQPGGE